MVSYARAAARLLLSLTVLSSDGSASQQPWSIHPERLPTPLSDQSATFLPRIPDSILPGDRIIVAGGCDSPLGNVLVDGSEGDQDGAGDGYDYFACTQLTRAVWAFDPDDPIGSQFRRLEDMPRERYRHAAVAAMGRIVLVGGRTVDDAIIREIDVYDPVRDSWSTPGSVPESYRTSDGAAFVDRDETSLYVAGGYDHDYAALDRAVRIDLTRLLDDANPTVSAEEVSELKTARGDVQAVTTEDGTYAYVTGGFHHANEFCSPLSSVERYDMVQDEWAEVDDLIKGRGEKALVRLNGRLYALGGESRPEGQCDADPNDTSPPPPLQDQSVVLDDVEVYDPSLGDGAVWTEADDGLPDGRFRFSAAPWEAGGKFYVLGGQEGYDPDCRCFRTSDVIVSVGEMSVSGASSAWAGAVGGGRRAAVAVLAGMAAGAAMLV